MRMRLLMLVFILPLQSAILLCIFIKKKKVIVQINTYVFKDSLASNLIFFIIVSPQIIIFRLLCNLQKKTALVSKISSILFYLLIFFLEIKFFYFVLIFISVRTLLHDIGEIDNTDFLGIFYYELTYYFLHFSHEQLTHLVIENYTLTFVSE